MGVSLPIREAIQEEIKVIYFGAVLYIQTPPLQLYFGTKFCDFNLSVIVIKQPSYSAKFAIKYQLFCYGLYNRQS